MNNLDPEVAERPQDLVVYGGAGKAARNWEAYAAIVTTLKRLGDDETLLVQSGKPVGVFRTHEDAPRVLIANAHLVPRWATWDEFRRLEALGLTMYGQMTAGSWIYIGTQGILQGTYETFADVARQHFGGSLAGRLVVSGGLGGHGRRAAAGRDHERRRVPGRRGGSAAHRAPGGRPATAIAWCADLDRGAGAGGRGARARERPLSVGLVGNVAEVLPELVRRGVVARRGHRPDLGPRPARRLHPARAFAGRGGARCASATRPGTRRPCWTRWWSTSRRCWPASARARWCSTTATTCAVRWPTAAGWRDAFDIPGFVPAYIRPLFCRGAGPFRWVALSGDPRDIAATDAGDAASCSRRRRAWPAGCSRPRDKVEFQGLPARICWLEYGERAEAGRDASTGW